MREELKDSSGRARYADVNQWLLNVLAEPHTQSCLQELENAVTAWHSPPTLLTSIPAAPSRDETFSFAVAWRKLGWKEDKFCRFAPSVPQVIDCSTFLLDREGCNSEESPIVVYFEDAAGVELQDGVICVDSGSGCVTACHMVLAVAALRGWHQQPYFQTLAPYLYKCMFLTCRYVYARDLTKRRRLSIVKKNEVTQRTRTTPLRLARTASNAWSVISLA